MPLIGRKNFEQPWRHGVTREVAKQREGRRITRMAQSSLEGSEFRRTPNSQKCTELLGRNQTVSRIPISQEGADQSGGRRMTGGVRICQKGAGS